MSAVSNSFTVGLGLAVAMALGPCAGALAAVQSDQPPQAHSDNLRAAADDTMTTAKVKERIATDKRLEDSKISVTTTNGIVTLTGSAPSHEDASTAEHVASAVNGVKGVDNRISAPSRLEGVAKRTEHKASDDWITTKVKGQILADRSVERGSDISVKTRDGVVTLYGTAASKNALDHARDIARHVKGVKSVDTTELRLASAE